MYLKLVTGTSCQKLQMTCLLSALKLGNHFLGIIPHSLRVPPWGWVPDLIAYYDLCQLHTDKQRVIVSEIPLEFAAVAYQDFQMSVDYLIIGCI